MDIRRVNSCDEDSPILIGVYQPGFVALESKKRCLSKELSDIEGMEKWIWLKNLDADLQIFVHVFDVVMLVLNVVNRKPLFEFFHNALLYFFCFLHCFIIILDLGKIKRPILFSPLFIVLI